MTTKATNPKDIIGGDNLPLHLVPYAVKVLTAIGLFNGAQKYGRGNYRVGGVQATVYLDAVERHLEGIKNGEELDPVDGVPHLCGLFASAAIYADAWAHGYLIDNRMPRPKGFRAWVDRMTAHVPRLRKLHEGKDPRHYTIQDTPEEKVDGPYFWSGECPEDLRGVSYTIEQRFSTPTSIHEGQVRDGEMRITRIDGKPVPETTLRDVAEAKPTIVHRNVVEANAKDEPYQGAATEESLGCSFLRFLPEFGARRRS